MKKENKSMLFFMLGIVVIVMLSIISLVNVFQKIEEESYSLAPSINENNLTGISSLEIDDNILNIYASNNNVDFCIKTTKSTPELNNICWKKTVNNNLKVSLLKYKKYYIWVKDLNNNIKGPQSIYSK